MADVDVGELDPETGLPADTAMGAVPLAGNIHVLAPYPLGGGRVSLDAQAERMRRATPDTVNRFDLPERDRMYRLAGQFVSLHVRRLRSGHAIKAVGRTFADGTLVVSETPFPRLALRVAKLNWAIEDGTITDVKDHRVLTLRLGRVILPSRKFIWAPGEGDTFDLAYLLANLTTMVGIELPEPTAVTGVVDLHTNAISGNGLMEAQREAAARDRISHLILPYGTHLMPGRHGTVKYWPVRDVPEAAYSMFAAASSDLAIPDLKRRWRIKMAYSWVSMLAALASSSVYQLAQGFAAHPTALAWMLGIDLALALLSIYTTHRYWRADR